MLSESATPARSFGTAKPNLFFSDDGADWPSKLLQPRQAKAKLST